MNTTAERKRYETADEAFAEIAPGDSDKYVMPHFAGGFIIASKRAVRASARKFSSQAGLASIRGGVR